ncbi:hypothetical protein [Magnetospirillum aberrantis]|uniref:MarR family transcriptional regulator n=1 Tax=Magnetospirillum aberrantis SpK TaxID=908842 RepID=A0A7C9QS85_9PROT|nr:hypothetical protein [Magnetospirillum aberrantis]NFV78921.1 hypothetical protein [Magnetospirillum aberrantis SpK]
MLNVFSENVPFVFRPAPLTPGEVSLLLAARPRPVARHQLTRDQLRVAEELVRLGYLSKTAEERKRRDRMFRLTRRGLDWLYDNGLFDGPRFVEQPHDP